MNPSFRGVPETAVPTDAHLRGRFSIVRTSALLLELSKGRLVALVVLTAAVGYLMAVPGGWSSADLFWTLAGTALAAAGSMALNQRIEV